MRAAVAEPAMTGVNWSESPFDRTTLPVPIWPEYQVVLRAWLF